MEDEAWVWFQDAEDAGQFTSWEAFIRSLHTRFGTSAYDDPMETLTKLRQVSSMAQYKGQFEALSNRVKEHPDKHKLSCFLSGLKEEIRLPVKMFNPLNLNAAFGLAKIQEEYLNASKRGTKSQGEAQVPRPSILGPPPNKNDFKPSKPPFQKILVAQIEDRRKKGLCFYCEEKWFARHKCKTPKVFLMEGVQASMPEVEVSFKEVQEEECIPSKSSSELISQPAEITLYALLGNPSLGTMRVLGRINHQELVVLIDTSSTHNFLDTSIWMLLKLPRFIEDSFEVKIANGTMVQTKGACHAVELKLQGQTFIMDLNVLSLGGCDVVQWYSDYVMYYKIV